MEEEEEGANQHTAELVVNGEQWEGEQHQSNAQQNTTPVNNQQWTLEGAEQQLCLAWRCTAVHKTSEQPKVNSEQSVMEHNNSALNNSVEVCGNIK